MDEIFDIENLKHCTSLILISNWLDDKDICNFV